MHALLRGTVALAAAGVAGVGYASLVERNWFALRRLSAPVLPPGARPLRVLHLTDLHLMPGQRRKVEWVQGLAALRPDLVVNTGDNIAHEDSIDVLARAFRPLFDVPGVFVLGSNDYYKPRLKNPFRYFLEDDHKRLAEGAHLPTERLVTALEGGGWTGLNNSRAHLAVAGERLEFIGVDDPHLSYDRYHVVAGPADPSATLTIGVTHAPYQRTLDAMTSDGAGLVIAGHTHGGQLCLPARRGTGDQLRPGPRARQGSLALVAWSRHRVAAHAGAWGRGIPGGVGRAGHLANGPGALRVSPGGDPADPDAAVGLTRPGWVAWWVGRQVVDWSRFLHVG